MQLERESLLAKIEILEQELKKIPKGTVVYKKIKGKAQPYLQWAEYGKTKSRYLKLNEREEILDIVARREYIKLDLENLRQQLAKLEQASQADGYDVHEWLLPRVAERENSYNKLFKTRVVLGPALLNMAQMATGLIKRNVYEQLEAFLHNDYGDKVCALYGLRRTGKTTLLRQLVLNMTEAELHKTVYIKAKAGDSLADFNDDLQELWQRGYKYILIDEITLLDDFIDGASLFSDIYAAQGMKIIFSGTDSLGFWLAESQELYDRVIMLHTTFISYSEHAKLLNTKDIDEYICFGGTLVKEKYFAGSSVQAEKASFLDDELARKYIDTAICRNIQHALASCKEGRYFRHLQELYEQDELTGAINRIIEDMNHSFVLKTLIADFKSHDLGSAAQTLRSARAFEQRTNILDKIDKAKITKKLQELLEIKNCEQQSVMLNDAHVHEVKEYLQGLDLIAAYSIETMVKNAVKSEQVVFTQPGMRYCQAKALVATLIEDEIFQSFSERERLLAQERILEDVRGRMLEDIVLFETSKAVEKKKRVFKLIFPRGEYDMVIYDPVTDCCELYEIKHSEAISKEQYRYLIDVDMLAAVSQRFGNIAKREVLYRGEKRVIDNGVVYNNVEEYLMNLWV